MYRYVKDKVFLKESYSICADIINQLVQNLKSYGVISRMSIVGSKKRGLITQNERGAIDYDFNLWIESAKDNLVRNPQKLKQIIIIAFKFAFKYTVHHNCFPPIF